MEVKKVAFAETHKDSIDALFIQQNYIFTGSKDMMVCVSDKESLNKIVVFDMRKVLNSSLAPEIRSICVNKNN
jgi:hypothetical protein